MLLWVFGLGLGGGRCGVGFVLVLAVLGLMFVVRGDLLLVVLNWLHPLCGWC